MAANSTGGVSPEEPRVVEAEHASDTGAMATAFTWRQFLFAKRPLQNETAWFILVNCLDIFMTYALIRFGAIESNPIANYVLQRWGFAAMIYFKLAIVAFVCVLAQIVALYSLWKAKAMMCLGLAIVAAVVIYSGGLVVRHFW